MKTKLHSLFITLITTFCIQLYAAPIISNVTVTNITATSVRINFSVNAQNSTSNAFVQYNTTPTMSGSFLQNGPINGNTPVALFQDITNLTPNTLYYYAIDAYNASNQAAVTITGSFTTGGTPPSTTNAIVSNITTSSAQINFDVNTFGIQSSIALDYGLNASSFTSYNVVSNTSTNTPTTFVYNFTGLSPNTTYYYSAGAYSPTLTGNRILGSFTTASPPTPQLVTEYNFNNTYNNINGNTPFSSNTGTSFVTGRNGDSNGALNIFDSGSNATIPNLPYGNSARSVSFWVKINSWNPGGEFSMVYSYGQGSASNANGVGLLSQHVGHFGYANNHTYTSTNTIIHQLATWYHYVMTYDGTTSRIYRNGALLASQAKTWNTLNNSNIFKLGVGVGGEISFNGAIDDLKIYNYAVTDAEAMNLYTYNSLATNTLDSKKFKATIQPNPTSDNFTIEMENEVKSIEIYSLQGQKVLTSENKNINVSNLPKGMYVVQIEDENNNRNTQKLIVK